MPKVSVVVPIYNVEKYLRECLDSIVGQTLKDIEIICVDDGSTDRSLSILREYEQKDPRIKVITKPNAGYGHSMNMGLDAATGEYMGIVDSDDYILPDMYETLYSHASTENLDMVRSDYYKFYETSNGTFSTYWVSMHKKYCDVAYCPKEQPLIYSHAVLIPSGIYKIEFLRKNGIRFNETPGAAFQDHGFWFQTYLLADKVKFISAAFYMYRFDNPNSSIYQLSCVDNISREYDYIGDFVEKHSELKYVTSPFYWKVRFLNSELTYSRVVYHVGPETVEKLAEPFKAAKKSGALDTSLFAQQALESLNLMLNNPKQYYRLLKAKTTYALYEEYIRRERMGVPESRYRQFIWYSRKFGIMYASEKAFKKLLMQIKAKIKNTMKKLYYKVDNMRTKYCPAYAYKKKTLQNINAFIQKQQDAAYKTEQLFWWSMNKPGETMSETQKRFYINMPKAEGALRAQQEHDRDVLFELKKVLDSSNISFWPMGGTLLGALRHKGFIPWDDDIDISMLYEDKERLFQAVAKSDVLRVDEVYWTGANTIYRCPLVRFKDAHNKGQIEVFMWDRAGNEPANCVTLWKKRNDIVQELNNEYRMLYPKLIRKDYFSEPVKIMEDKMLLENLYEKYRKKCRECIPSTGTTVYGSIDMSYEKGRWCAVYPSKYIELSRSEMFEGEKIRIPAYTEKMLKDQYGDWMALPGKIRPSHPSR